MGKTKKKMRKQEKKSKPQTKIQKAPAASEKQGDPSPVSRETDLSATTQTAGNKADRARAMVSAQQQMGNTRVNRMVGDAEEKKAARMENDDEQAMRATAGEEGKAAAAAEEETAPQRQPAEEESSPTAASG